MRDKILSLISVGVEQTISGLINDLTKQFKAGFTELPPEALESLALTESTLRACQPKLEEEIINLYKLHFSETQIDELFAREQSELGKYLNEIGPVIQQERDKRVGSWLNETMRSIEPQLTKLLGTSIDGVGEGATTAEQVPTKSLSPEEVLEEIKDEIARDAEERYAAP